MVPFMKFWTTWNEITAELLIRTFDNENNNDFLFAISVIVNTEECVMNQKYF